MTIGKQSPLIEAQASSLDELFANAPTLSDEELDTIIDASRSFCAQAEHKRKVRAAKMEAKVLVALDDETFSALLDQTAG